MPGGSNAFLHRQLRAVELDRSSRRTLSKESRALHAR